MQSTSSSFKTIIKENFKRNWAIAVLAYLAYFMTGILPVMMNYRRFDDVSIYAASYVAAQNVLLYGIIIISAIVASLAVFHYLHHAVDAGAMHAMPINRKKLFLSSAISGWLLTALPLLATALTFLTLRGATISAEGRLWLSEIQEGLGEAREIFSIGHILQFAVISLVILTFVYALCCLAAVIAGQPTIHALLAMFLLAVPFLLMGLIESILSTFLFGFPGLRWDVRLFSAFGYAFSREFFALDVRYLIYYLVLSAIFMAAAYLIYCKVPLERVGQATTFPVAADILCIVLTFIIGLGLALIIVALGGDDPASAGRFSVTAVITSAVVYCLMRMIADSTPAVFHAKTLKKYGIYLVLLAAFLAVAVFDVTGYGKRVLAPSRIASVTLSMNGYDDVGEFPVVFTDPETIDAVARLQQAVIDAKDASGDYFESLDHMEIEWKKAGGGVVRRSYDLVQAEGDDAVKKAYANLYRCEEFQENLRIDIEKLLSDSTDVRLGEWGGEMEEDSVVVEKDDQKELLAALNADVQKRSFEQWQEHEWEFAITVIKPKAGLFEGTEVDSYEVYHILACDEETIAFLEGNGYYEQLEELRRRHMEEAENDVYADEFEEDFSVEFGDEVME